MCCTSSSRCWKERRSRANVAIASSRCFCMASSCNKVPSCSFCSITQGRDGNEHEHVSIYTLLPRSTTHNHKQQAIVGRTCRTWYRSSTSLLELCPMASAHTDEFGVCAPYIGLEALLGPFMLLWTPRTGTTKATMRQQHGLSFKRANTRLQR